MFAREIRLGTRSKLGAVVLALVLLGVLGVFLTFGLVLLIGLAAAGLVLGLGTALLRRLTGRPAPNARVGSRQGLDPAREISPPDQKSDHVGESPRD